MVPIGLSAYDQEEIDRSLDAAKRYYDWSQYEITKLRNQRNVVEARLEAVREECTCHHDCNWKALLAQGQETPE